MDLRPHSATACLTVDEFPINPGKSLNRLKNGTILAGVGPGVNSPPGTDRVRKPPDRNRQPADNAAMDLDPDACYRAISTRDARFDGRLFVGVTTTGIY